MTERSDRTVTSDDLRGHIWIADFIFTTCAGPCPVLTSVMHGLQESLGENDSEVKLVSFTTDPTYDTPKVLRAYAERNQADPDIWWFLTGPVEEEIHDLIERGFLQTVIPASADSPIIHSTYLVLVDRQGRIRGFYEGLDEVSRSRLPGDVELLRGETWEP